MYEQEITSWFKKNARDLPWRKTDAWGVLVSEIMLQQTPVARVLPVYTEWMKRWPTAAHLAKATPAEVITAWGRLGYPRRALRLHECAKVITNELGGEIPTTEVELRKLPGIGEYTAAAMVAFASCSHAFIKALKRQLLRQQRRSALNLRNMYLRRTRTYGLRQRWSSAPLSALHRNHSVVAALSQTNASGEA